MIRTYRAVSVLVALGLVAGAIGVAPILAKQLQQGGLGQTDAADAPQAVVPLTEDTVDWADSEGESIAFVKPGSVGVFFIKDGALETTKAATATWHADNQAVTANASFSIPDGNLAGAAASGTYTLVAPSYDAGTPANTPLTSAPTVVSGGNGQIVSSFNTDAGTFSILLAVAANSTTTATFSHHVRDTYPQNVTVLRRAKVTSTSDPQGEFVTIFEVSGVGDVASGKLVDVVNEAATTAANGLSVTAANVPIVDKDGDGDVDKVDVVISVGGSPIASSTIASVNFETGTPRPARRRTLIAATCY